MIKCLDEIEKVTTDDAVIIFVVGDKKLSGEVINGGDFFTRISKLFIRYAMSMPTLCLYIFSWES